MIIIIIGIIMTGIIIIGIIETNNLIIPDAIEFHKLIIITIIIKRQEISKGLIKQEILGHTKVKTVGIRPGKGKMNLWK